MDISEKEEHLKRIVKSSVNYINNDLKLSCGKEVKVELNIIGENNSINAFADRKEDDTYVVGIYWGTYHWIDDFWKKILTNPNFCSILGISEYSEEIAQKYYSIMLVLSLKCVIFHELGHIINGHVDYIKNKDGKDIKLYEKDDENETNNEKLRNIEPITWQSMEWNADDFAASRVIGQSTYKDMIDNYVIKNEEHGLWLATVAQAVTYSLMYMGIENRIKSDYKKMRHLPLRFRLEFIIKNMVQVSKVLNPNVSIDVQFEKCMKSMTRVEEWVNLFMKDQYKSKLNVSTENNRDELDGSHRDYYKEVERYYLNKLENELKDYAYMKVVGIIS